MKIGNWKFNKRSRVVEYSSEKFQSYEVDLDRSTCNQWIAQLTAKSWITEKDIADLEYIFDLIKLKQPDLKIFTNKDQEFLSLSKRDAELLLPDDEDCSKHPVNWKWFELE